MRQYAGEEVADTLGAVGVVSYRFGEHLVDGLVEPDHLLERLRAGGGGVLPAAQHRGAQRPEFSHHIVDAVSVRQAIFRMPLGDLVEAGGPGVAVAT